MVSIRIFADKWGRFRNLRWKIQCVWRRDDSTVNCTGKIILKSTRLNKWLKTYYSELEIGEDLKFYTYDLKICDTCRGGVWNEESIPN